MNGVYSDIDSYEPEWMCGRRQSGNKDAATSNLGCVIGRKVRWNSRG